ncbi:MAG: SUMF1/EgtB/PvdO family nonheme iron enzyme, partial [Anaerolineae bacterium]|nr:SUMF1/EgtB/PvdO family nonheme iron enzyme [Anaerolineae bacterium]
FLQAFVSPDIMPFLYFISVLLIVVPIVAYVMLERKPKPEIPLTPTPPLQTGPEPVSLQSASSWKRAYLQTVRDDCQRLRVPSTDSQTADPQRGGKSLANVYTALDTSAREEQKSKDELERQFTREGPHISALGALLRESDHRIVLVGQPGSGKSTFVRYLLLRNAEALLDRKIELNREDCLPGWTSGPRWPVMLSLATLAELILPEGERGMALVEKAIRSRVDARVKGVADALLQTLKDEGGVIGFDGLDEVSNTDLRETVQEALQAFAVEYPLCWCVVTCRTYSYTDPDWQFSWPRYDLEPLSPEKMAEFVKLWYAESTRLDRGRADQYEMEKNRLLKALDPDDERHLAQIAENPLILTIMAIVNSKADLPHTRVQVYEECVKLLVNEWEVKRTADTEKVKQTLLSKLGLPAPNTLYQILQKVAYKVRLDAEPEKKREERAGEEAVNVVSITETLLKYVLDEFLNDDQKVNIFLECVREANGLLMSEGQAAVPGLPNAKPRHRYAFPHQSFGEYLAGRYLAEEYELDPHYVRDRLEHIDLWREPLKFLGEHLCFGEGKGREKPINEILGVLTPEKAEPTTEMDWRAVAMAGEWLKSYRRQFATRPSPHDARIVKRLEALLETGALTPVERAAAGRALAELGDLRDEVTTVDKAQFCYVPGGDFWMGGEGPFDGKPLHQYTRLTSGYWMARYPITNAQFTAFVKDEGYKKAEWWNWSDAALSWWKENKRTGPYDYGTPFNLPNHPVVGVTWYETIAFCRWLTQRWRAKHWLLGDWEVRLPTEAEWEKAARGGLYIPTTLLCLPVEKLAPEPLLGVEKNPRSQQAYPWGDDPDPNRANYADSGINTTSAVGAFPGGATPYGALEMSGNVWEWCLTQWVDNYENYVKTEANGLEGDAVRVLRGGAFYLDVRFARCAYRNWYDPLNDFRGYGFRVVVVGGAAAPIDSEL